MVKKNQKWEWTERQEEAFRELKKKFTTELVLVAPDLNLSQELHTGYQINIFRSGKCLFGVPFISDSRTSYFVYHG